MQILDFYGVKTDSVIIKGLIKVVRRSIARWYFFIPKSTTLVHFGRASNGIFDNFYDHLVYFVVICFILWQFGKCT
jgi:hypothetical protein